MGLFDNKNNYDEWGRLDLSIKRLHVTQEMEQCPICKEVHEVVTCAHFMKNHNMTLNEAKEAKKQVEIVKPFNKRGKEFINERNKVTGGYGTYKPKSK